jgi:hypothetical protein
MRQLTRLSIAFAALAAVFATLTPARTAAQMLTGLRSEWGDLETWTHAVESTRESELGLGLQLNGGTTLVAFMGRLSARDPRTPPRDLGVQVGTGKMTNSTLIRRPVLNFVIDEGTDKRKSVDLSGRLNVDNPAPGAIITDAVSRIDATDFLQLAGAAKIRGTILGIDVTFRPDQIAALKSFAERLQFKVSR